MKNTKIKCFKIEYELISHDGGDCVYEKKIPCYPNDAQGRIANLTQKEMAFITMAIDSIDLSQSSNEIEELRNKIKRKLEGTYAYE